MVFGFADMMDGCNSNTVKQRIAHARNTRMPWEHMGLDGVEIDVPNILMSCGLTVATGRRIRLVAVGIT